MSCYLGLDVAKASVVLASEPAGPTGQFATDPSGLQALVAACQAQPVTLIVLEATGGYEAPVAAALATAGLPVAIVNPRQVRAFAQALGKRAKTDPIDAAVIAHFAEAAKPKLRQMPDEVTRLLADLVARRRQIVEMIAAEAQRTRRMSDKRLTKSVARLRKALEKELSELDVLIDDQIRGSAVWVEKEDLLASVPGVGKPAGTRFARPSTDRGPCRARALDPPVRAMARQELHRRRSQERAQLLVRRRHGRRALQSAAQKLPRQTRRRRKAEAHRSRR